MKKLLVLSLVLLLGVTCMARTDYFEAVYIEGAFTLSGTSAVSFTGTTLAYDMSSTVVIDGATSVRGVSAGFTSLESPANRLGVSSTIYMQIATAATTGITTITHTGSAPTVTWTANSFDFVGAMAADAVTLSDVLTFSDAGTIDNTAADTLTLTEDNVAVVGEFGVTGGIAVDGATVLLDGSTSARAVSAGFTSLESPANRLGVDASVYMQVATTATTGITAITHTGTAPTVTWTANSFDFVGDIALDAVTASGAVSVDDVTDTSSAVTGSIHTDGGVGIAKKLWVGTDLAVDGTANLDNTDIDGTLDVQGVTTFQANATVATATNAGALFISAYNLVYTQTDSAVTVCTLPANAYVTEVKVMTTTAFNESGTLTCDIGWSGTLEGYAGDLDIKDADGWAYADVYTGFGVSVGGTARDILVSIADQNDDGTAGAATVYIEWTMGAPGSL